MDQIVLVDGENGGDRTVSDEGLAHLNFLLAEACAAAHAALTSWQAENALLSTPLSEIIGVMDAHRLTVANDLGDAGFVLDETKEIQFNASALERVVRFVVDLFGNGLPAEEKRNVEIDAVGLYIFHELSHVLQNFITHPQAKAIKRTFGADEVPRMDVISDIRAAHCVALTKLDRGKSLEDSAYLKCYRDNIMTSYEVLINVFGVQNSDGKKKRALGLLTNAMLAQEAINAEPEAKAELIKQAVRPTFVAVDPEDQAILCQICGSGGWTILFHGVVKTNRISLEEMWNLVGDIDPADIIALLQASYQQLK